MISVIKKRIEEHESEVILKDDSNELLCLCYDNVDNLEEFCIHTFLAKNIFKNDKQNEKAVKLSDYFSYKLFCKVTNSEKGLVNLGEFEIFLDSPLPSDISNDDYIEFEVVRLDIFWLW